MEVMGRVREIGADGDGRLAVANPPIGSHDCREGRDRGDRVVERVSLAAEAENGRRHAQGVDGRHIHSRSLAKDFDCRVGQRAPSGQVLHECNTLRWSRQAAMQEQVSDFLECGMRRQIFHCIPGKDQLPRLSINMA